MVNLQIYNPILPKNKQTINKTLNSNKIEILIYRDAENTQQVFNDRLSKLSKYCLKLTPERRYSDSPKLTEKTRRVSEYPLKVNKKPKKSSPRVDIAPRVSIEEKSPSEDPLGVIKPFQLEYWGYDMKEFKNIDEKS